MRPSPFGPKTGGFVNSGNLTSHSTGGWVSPIKAPAWLSEGPLRPALPMPSLWVPRWTNQGSFQAPKGTNLIPEGSVLMSQAPTRGPASK